MGFLKFVPIAAIIAVVGFMSLQGCRHRAPFCTEGFADRAISRIDKRIAKLKLTDAQKQKYEEIKTAAKNDFSEYSKKRKSVHAEIGNELSERNPDMRRIARIALQAHRERPQKFEEYVSKVLELYEMLDDAQKAMVVEEMRTHHDRMGCR